jgi:hypothetical protein
LDEATRNELRRKNLCFHCKDPWVPRHRCQGKGQAHYIEVHSYYDEEEEEQEVALEQGKEEKEETEEKHSEEAKKVVIASLSGTPRFNTFRVTGIIRGQGVTASIDGGATHNFIDAAWVARRRVATEDFEGFKVAVADRFNVSCKKKIPRLALTIGNYTLT